MSRRPGNSFMQLWGAPLLLSVLTLIGLVFFSVALVRFRRSLAS